MRRAATEATEEKISDRLERWFQQDLEDLALALAGLVIGAAGVALVVALGSLVLRLLDQLF